MRAVITTILLLLLLTNCKDRKTATVTHTSTSDTASETVNLSQSIDRTDQIDTTLLHVDTAIIFGEKYTAFYKSNDTLYVLNMKADTILKVADLHSNFEFDDFNRDGLRDIRIHYNSNVPAIQELLLFDKSAKNFRLIKNFSDFPDPKPLPGTKYFYSYHRSGCADMNWDSDLFYIDNYKAIKIGNIAGYECDSRDVKDGIYIHKVQGDMKTLMEKKPIGTIGQYKDYKWGFIKAYWTRNYKQFL